MKHTQMTHLASLTLLPLYTILTINYLNNFATGYFEAECATASKTILSAFLTLKYICRRRMSWVIGRQCCVQLMLYPIARTSEKGTSQEQAVLGDSTRTSGF